jgi:hypothetical protein
MLDFARAARILTACGNTVNYLRKDVRKKCVRLYTVFVQAMVVACRTWINNYFTRTIYTVILPTLSTYKNKETTSVAMRVLPTFHNTYYNYYQFVRKDI